MTGRTVQKHYRVYADGYNLSGMARTIGPIGVTYDEADLTAYMGDTVKGYLRNHAQSDLGALNAVFDNTATTGIHGVLLFCLISSPFHCGGNQIYPRAFTVLCS